MPVKILIRRQGFALENPQGGYSPLTPFSLFYLPFRFFLFILLNSISHLSPGHIPELPDFMAVLRKNALRARVHFCNKSYFQKGIQKGIQK